MATVASNPVPVAGVDSGSGGARLTVNPDGVVAAGSRVAAAGADAPVVASIAPAAPDPVSIGVAATLSARVAALTAYGGAAAVIREYHAGLLWASADAYSSQDGANGAGLAPGSGGPAPTMTALPPAPVVPLPPASVPAPVFGAPPGGGEAIAQLVHAGSPDPLYAAAQQLRRYATELDDTGEALRAVSRQLPGEWWSRAGEEADIAVHRLGGWYLGHADHANAAAATAEAQADNYAQAKAAIPTPKQFADNTRSLAAATAAAARNPIYTPVVTKFQAERTQLETQATSHYANYQTAAATSNLAGDPLDLPPRPHNDTQMLGGPYGRAPQEPPPTFPSDPVDPNGGAGAFGPDDPNPRYPGRDNSGRFTDGNTGSADGATAAEKALQDYEREFETSLNRQQVRVAIIDPSTGQPILDLQTGKPLYRYYDALEPVPGQPGKYIGVEVKSGSADLSRTQRIFDNTVSPGTPATGRLNGQPIEVIGARKLDAPQFVPERPAAGGGGPGIPKAPSGGAPVEGAPRAGPSAGPRAGGGGGPMPRLPMGSVPWDSPVTGPHPVPPPHSHWSPPVLGESTYDADEFE